MIQRGHVRWRHGARVASNSLTGSGVGGGDLRQWPQAPLLTAKVNLHTGTQALDEPDAD